MSILDNRLSQIAFSKAPIDGLLALDINFVLSRLAASMLDVFGPLFFFYLAQDKLTGLYYLLFYYVVMRIFVIATAIPMGKLVAKFGYRKSMLVGQMAMAIQLAILANLDSFVFWPVMVSIIFSVLSVNFYFISFHGLFLDDNNDKKVGSQIGFLAVLARVSLIMSPLIAGFITQNFGFNAMFAFAFLLLVVSLVPLFRMQKHERHVSTFQGKKVVDYIFGHKNTSFFMFFWSATDGIQVILFPVFLFLIIGAYSLFGVILAIIGVFNMISVYFSGRMYDKRKSSKIFNLSVIVVCVSSVFMFMSNLLWVVVGANFVKKLIAPLWWMKIRRLELLEGERHDHLVFAVGHEIVWSAGLIFVLVWSGVLLAVSGLNFQTLIIPAVFTTIAASVFAKIKDDK